VLQEFLFDRVLGEPGDGAQPPGDRGAGPAPSFQVAGEGVDVGAADGEQVQGMGAAPAGELAQVKCVGFAGQAAVSGQEPASASGSASLNASWVGTRAVVVAAVIGAPPGSGLRPGGGGSRGRSNDKATSAKAL
jgi:hypothetical protein